jgi:hypothetical protein
MARFRMTGMAVLALALLGSCASVATAPPVEPATPATPAAMPAGPIALPDSIDLRPQFAAFGLQPRGQGKRPTCSIFTTVSAFEFAFARATGHGERLSVEYANWAANAATGRSDDGDFFHCALAGYERFGIAAEPLQPYAAKFANEPPPPDALVDAGRRLARDGSKVQVRWIRPIGGGAGLSTEQFDDLLHTIAAGFPVAAGSAHSRLLIGYRKDPSAAGGGIFTTLDSALAKYAEVPFEFVQKQVNDAFTVEIPASNRS